MAATSVNKRGLGRGLTAIIPGAEQEEESARNSEERLFNSLVEAGFDLLDELISPELSAYLHAPHGGVPELFLRNPTLAGLTPSTAFRMFHQMALLTNGEDDEGTFVQDDLEGYYFRSAGSASDGMHYVAALGLHGDEDRIALARRTALAFADVCHQVHDTGAASAKAPRLVIEVDNGETTVTAHLDDLGRTGKATSANRTEAVALAVLATHDGGYELSEIRDVDLEDRTAVVTVITHPDHGVRLGLAMTETDVMEAAAIAASRAVGAA
jgi:hypothetical protein